MRLPLDGSTILVTGASSGLGREFARQLAPRARRLVLVARRTERLRELAAELARPGLDVDVVPCDLTDRSATDAMLAAAGDVDVLVNNAGSGDFGVFDLADWPKTEQLLRVNIDAVAYLTHRLVPGMIARGRGGVLNVSSGFGLQVLPGFAAYCGAKHFVTAFSEVLRLDLAGTGVVVTQLCPGPVPTEFEQVTGNFTGHDVPRFIQISPGRCVRAALRGFARGRAMVIPGFWIKLVLGISALAPRFLRRLVLTPIGRRVRAIQRKALGERSGAR